MSWLPIVWCVAATLVLSLAYREVGWSYVDSANNLAAAGDHRSWHEVISDVLTKSLEYRPLLDIGTRVAYQVVGLSLTTYKAIVAIEFLLLLVALAVLFHASGWRRVLAAIVALSVAAGLHTSQILFLFVPLNAYSSSLLLMLAVALLTLTPRLRGYEWVLLPITLVAALWLEIAVFIVPIVTVAWLMKAPGTTWRSVAASTTGLAIYFVARFGWGSGIASLTSPDTGLGFSSVSPAESAALFANAPWLFWLHNIGTTFLSVLASEPRAGRFVFIRSLLRGTVPPWMWLHVLSSLATTAVVCVGLIGIRSRPQRDRLVAAFGAILLAGGSALGFLYTRDRIGLPAGIGYAMLAYVALSALLERARARWLLVPASACVVVLGICWTVRTGELYMALRDTAWDYHGEWADRYQPSKGDSSVLTQLYASTMSRYPEDPRRDPLWTYEIFQRRYEPLRDACVSDGRPVVDDVSRHLLGKAADAGTAAHWAERLEDGTASVLDVVRSIALSPDYARHLEKSGSPDEGVVTLYQHVFGRLPDPEGAKWATGIATTQGFPPLVRELVGSAEYRERNGEWRVPGGGLTFCR